MPTIRFTSALKRFYPNIDTMHLKATTISEMLMDLNTLYPGISDFLLDEHGSLRHHINIFIGDQMIADRTQLSDTVTDKDEILIFQALSGG